MCILGDRCISVVNPSRSTDSCRGLVTRIRVLLLVAYAKAVSLLEDHVRQQREKRNEPGWNFMKYFELQVIKSTDLQKNTRFISPLLN